MTEAQIEYLEKEFPRGFVIACIQPNGNMLVLKNNPDGVKSLNVIADVTNTLIDTVYENFYKSESTEGEEWKHGGRDNVPS